MKGKRCPDTKLFEGHLLHLRDNLSQPVQKIKAMGQPGPADPPPVISYGSYAGAFTKKDVVFCIIVKRLHLFTGF